MQSLKFGFGRVMWIWSLNETCKSLASYFLNKTIDDSPNEAHLLVCVFVCFIFGSPFRMHGLDLRGLDVFRFPFTP